MNINSSGCQLPAIEKALNSPRDHLIIIFAVLQINGTQIFQDAIRENPLNLCPSVSHTEICRHSHLIFLRGKPQINHRN